ncbi:hypothetical protein SUDANB96_06632 [Streptomyces sp. enrichment culture]
MMRSASATAYSVSTARTTAHSTRVRVAQPRLDGGTGAHLVGGGADSGHTGGDVGWLGAGPAAQVRLEEPRRFVDLQAHPGDRAVVDMQAQRALALALDPGERADVQDSGSAVCHGAGSFAKAAGLKVCSRRPTAASSRPSRRSGTSAGRFTDGRAEATAPVGRAQGAAAGVRDRAEAGGAVGDRDAHGAAPLALEADAVARHIGLAPGEERGDDLEPLPPVDRAAAQLEVDVHMGGDGRGAGECGDVLGVGVDRAPVPADVREVAQGLDATGGRTGGRHLADRGPAGAGGASPHIEPVAVGRPSGACGRRDLADSYERRCVGAQPGGELLDRRCRSAHLALRSPVDVGQPAGQAERGGGVVDEGPEADALDDALDVEVLCGHDGLLAEAFGRCRTTSCSTASASGSMAAATAGERPVPNEVSAPSTAYTTRRPGSSPRAPACCTVSPGPRPWELVVEVRATRSPSSPAGGRVRASRGARAPRPRPRPARLPPSPRRRRTGSRCRRR